MKKCNGCLTLKDASAFSFAKSAPDGLNYTCKDCNQARKRSYDGHARKMYSSQKSHSIERGHPPPGYTCDQFIEWLGANGYGQLHAAWVESDYEKKAAPSADRLEDSLPYSLDNIRLMKWDENCKKMGNDFISGKLRNQHTVVRQLTKEGEFVAEYVSQHAAERATGVHNSKICAVCLEYPGHLTAGGFIWQYVPAAPTPTTGDTK